jgi:hypothetical protein
MKAKLSEAGERERALWDADCSLLLANSTFTDKSKWGASSPANGAGCDSPATVPTFVNEARGGGTLYPLGRLEPAPSFACQEGSGS